MTTSGLPLLVHAPYEQGVLLDATRHVNSMEQLLSAIREPKPVHVQIVDPRGSLLRAASQNDGIVTAFVHQSLPEIAQILPTDHLFRRMADYAWLMRPVEKSKDSIHLTRGSLEKACKVAAHRLIQTGKTSEDVEQEAELTRWFLEDAFGMAGRAGVELLPRFPYRHVVHTTKGSVSKQLAALIRSGSSLLGTDARVGDAAPQITVPAVLSCPACVKRSAPGPLCGACLALESHALQAPVRVIPNFTTDPTAAATKLYTAFHSLPLAGHFAQGWLVGSPTPSLTLMRNDMAAPNLPATGKYHDATFTEPLLYAPAIALGLPDGTQVGAFLTSPQHAEKHPRGFVASGGNRWLRNALNVVAGYDRVHDIVHQIDDRRGLYGVRLFQWNTDTGAYDLPVTMHVDDRLPKSTGLRSEVAGQIWPGLVEKAFAKATTMGREISLPGLAARVVHPATAVAEMLGGKAWVLTPVANFADDPEHLLLHALRAVVRPDYVVMAQLADAGGSPDAFVPLRGVVKHRDAVGEDHWVVHALAPGPEPLSAIPLQDFARRLVYLSVVQPLPASEDQSAQQLPAHAQILQGSNLASSQTTVPAEEAAIIYQPATNLTEIEMIRQAIYEASAPRRAVARQPINRAVIVGLNYYGSEYALRGCVDDAHAVHRMLLQTGFRGETRILTDEPAQQTDAVPTLRNLIGSLQWLLSNARAGDSLFFYFAGHGAQVSLAEGNKSKADAIAAALGRAPAGSPTLAQALCPADFTDGAESPFRMLLEDELHTLLVKPLPVGARLTVLLDSSHNGSFNLPFAARAGAAVRAPASTDAAEERGEVLLLTATRDDPISAAGELSHAFIAAIQDSYSAGITLGALLARITAGRIHPELSSNRPLAADTRFSLYSEHGPAGRPRGIVTAPEVRPDGTHFLSTAYLTLACDTPKAAIHYTLDGSQPTRLSRRYVSGQPVVLRQEGTHVLRAVAFTDDLVPSTVATKEVTVLGQGPALRASPFKPNVRWGVGEANGVGFEYFRGKWGALPDFTKLAPQQIGLRSYFDSSPLDSATEQFGFIFKAEVDLPTPGEWGIVTNSDREIRLLVDKQMAIDNKAGAQVFRAQLGQGRHLVELHCHFTNINDRLAVQWHPPAGAVGDIPLANLFPIATPRGLRYTTYDGIFKLAATSAAESFATAVPAGKGVMETVSALPSGAGQPFGLRLRGGLRIYTPGTYTLRLRSNGGSKLFVDGALALDNSTGGERQATLPLSSDLRNITIEYTSGNAAGTPSLDLALQGPGFREMTSVPGFMLHPSGAGVAYGMRIALSNLRQQAHLAADATGAVGLQSQLPGGQQWFIVTNAPTAVASTTLGSAYRPIKQGATVALLHADTKKYLVYDATQRNLLLRDPDALVETQASWTVVGPDPDHPWLLDTPVQIKHADANVFLGTGSAPSLTQTTATTPKVNRHLPVKAPWRLSASANLQYREYLRWGTKIQLTNKAGFESQWYWVLPAHTASADEVRQKWQMPVRYGEEVTFEDGETHKYLVGVDTLEPSQSDRSTWQVRSLDGSTGQYVRLTDYVSYYNAASDSSLTRWGHTRETGGAWRVLSIHRWERCAVCFGSKIALTYGTGLGLHLDTGAGVKGLATGDRRGAPDWFIVLPADRTVGPLWTGDADAVHFGQLFRLKHAATGSYLTARQNPQAGTVDYIFTDTADNDTSLWAAVWASSEGGAQIGAVWQHTDEFELYNVGTCTFLAHPEQTGPVFPEQELPEPDDVWNLTWEATDLEPEVDPRRMTFGSKLRFTFAPKPGAAAVGLRMTDAGAQTVSEDQADWFAVWPLTGPEADLRKWYTTPLRIGDTFALQHAQSGKWLSLQSTNDTNTDRPLTLVTELGDNTVWGALLFRPNAEAPAPETAFGIPWNTDTQVTICARWMAQVWGELPVAWDPTRWPSAAALLTRPNWAYLSGADGNTFKGIVNTDAKLPLPLGFSKWIPSEGDIVYGSKIRIRFPWTARFLRLDPAGTTTVQSADGNDIFTVYPSAEKSVDVRSLLVESLNVVPKGGTFSLRSNKGTFLGSTSRSRGVLLEAQKGAESLPGQSLDTDWLVDMRADHWAAGVAILLQHRVSAQYLSSATLTVPDAPDSHLVVLQNPAQYSLEPSSTYSRLNLRGAVNVPQRAWRVGVPPALLDYHTVYFGSVIKLRYVDTQLTLQSSPDTYTGPSSSHQQQVFTKRTHDDWAYFVVLPAAGTSEDDLRRLSFTTVHHGDNVTLVHLKTGRLISARPNILAPISGGSLGDLEVACYPAAQTSDWDDWTVLMGDNGGRPGSPWLRDQDIYLRQRRSRLHLHSHKLLLDDRLRHEVTVRDPAHGCGSVDGCKVHTVDENLQWTVSQIDDTHQDYISYGDRLSLAHVDTSRLLSILDSRAGLKPLAAATPAQTRADDERFDRSWFAVVPVVDFVAKDRAPLEYNAPFALQHIASGHFIDVTTGLLQAAAGAVPLSGTPALSTPTTNWGRVWHVSASPTTAAWKATHPTIAFVSAGQRLRVTHEFHLTSTTNGLLLHTHRESLPAAVSTNTSVADALHLVAGLPAGQRCWLDHCLAAPAVAPPRDQDDGTLWRVAAVGPAGATLTKTTGFNIRAEATTQIIYEPVPVVNAVQYGSVIKLEHVKTGTLLFRPGFSYTHPQSSKGTAVAGKVSSDLLADDDSTAYWKVLPQAKSYHPADKIGEPVRWGSLVQLQNLQSGEYLQLDARFLSPVTSNMEASLADSSNPVTDAAQRATHWTVQYHAPAQPHAQYWQVDEPFYLVNSRTLAALVAAPAGFNGCVELCGIASLPGPDACFRVIHNKLNPPEPESAAAQNRAVGANARPFVPQPALAAGQNSDANTVAINAIVKLHCAGWGHAALSTARDLRINGSVADSWSFLVPNQHRSRVPLPGSEPALTSTLPLSDVVTATDVGVGAAEWWRITELPRSSASQTVEGGVTQIALQNLANKQFLAADMGRSVPSNAVGVGAVFCLDDPSDPRARWTVEIADSKFWQHGSVVGLRHTQSGRLLGSGNGFNGTGLTERREAVIAGGNGPETRWTVQAIAGQPSIGSESLARAAIYHGLISFHKQGAAPIEAVSGTIFAGVLHGSDGHVSMDLTTANGTTTNLIGAQQGAMFTTDSSGHVSFKVPLDGLFVPDVWLHIPKLMPSTQRLLLSRQNPLSTERISLANLTEAHLDPAVTSHLAGTFSALAQIERDARSTALVGVYAATNPETGASLSVAPSVGVVVDVKRLLGSGNAKRTTSVRAVTKLTPQESKKAASCNLSPNEFEAALSMYPSTSTLDHTSRSVTTNVTLWSNGQQVTVSQTCSGDWRNISSMATRFCPNAAVIEAVAKRISKDETV